MQESSKHFVRLPNPIDATESSIVPKPRFAVAGLFAGIAGFELGFRQHGHEAAILCEAEGAAKSVLAHQFPLASIASDVRQLRSLDDCDVVTAGFPCQDLSQVGRTKGIEGNDSGLINEVFRLLKKAKPKTKWLVLENVPFMLRLHDGHAIRYITSVLDELGWHWAYRTIDSRAFGLPQRRLRVFIVASRDADPRNCLLSDDVGHQEDQCAPDTPRGFYWTEGHRGLGRAINAIPPLKGGSGLSIPSPPAVWFPSTNNVVTPSIEAAERLQGFPAGWTEGARSQTNGERRRWRLVGNAVSVPVAAWVAHKLSFPSQYDSARDAEFSPLGKWPQAASRVEGRLTSSSVSAWPVSIPMLPIASFLGDDSKQLSLRAASGFLGRLEHSSLRHDEAFVSAMRKYVAMMQNASASPKPPKSEDVSRRMAATRGRDNAVELGLRSALHRLGYRFRVQYKAVPGLRRTADIAFPSLRVAIFVDGCFWHGCPIHGTWPKHNAQWWREKIEANRTRDKDTDKKFRENGWTVVRVWEHENAEVVARRISHLLITRQSRRKVRPT